MRYMAAVLLFIALALPCARAQSSSSDASSPDSKAPQDQPHKVWSNEDLKQLHGGLSVVGPVVAKPNYKKAAPAKKGPPKPPGIAFRARTLDGKVITSDDLYDQTVLVQYWSTRCRNCVADQSAVDQVAKAFANQGVVILAVDEEARDSEQTVRQYLQMKPRAVPIILRADSNLDKVIPVKGYPTYAVVNGDGHVVASRSGAIGEQGMRDLLAKAGVTAN